MTQRLTNPTRIHEDVGSIPGLAYWLGIQCCSELWCRSQTQLRSGVAVAVAVAGSCSSNVTPSLGTSICCGCSAKKEKKIEENFLVCVCVCVCFNQAHSTHKFPGQGSNLWHSSDNVRSLTH